MIARETLEKTTTSGWSLEGKARFYFNRGGVERGIEKGGTIPGSEIGTHEGGRKEHDVLANSEKLAGRDIPPLTDTWWCKPVMEIPLPFAREKDGAEGVLEKQAGAKSRHA